MSTSRPGGVTLAAVLAIALGILQLLTGVILLFGGIIAAGVIAVIVGVLTLVVSVGLLAGRDGSRLVAAIVVFLNIGNAIYIFIVHDDQRWSAILSVAFSALVLVLLFSPRANRFFRS